MRSPLRERHKSNSAACFLYSDLRARVCARCCPACEKRHLRKSIMRLFCPGDMGQQSPEETVIDRRAHCLGWGWFSSLLYRRERAPPGMQHQSESSYLKQVLPSLLKIGSGSVNSLFLCFVFAASPG